MLRPEGLTPFWDPVFLPHELSLDYIILFFLRKASLICRHSQIFFYEEQISMDKNAIKKYAIWARRELIERVSQRAMIYGISAADAGDPNADSVNGHLLSQAEKRQRQALIAQIREKGFQQVMEEVAYTWFNRFAALRFMEVNGYLPSHIRVFTNDEGEFKPQILTEAIHLELDGLDMNRVYELENANKSEELFKYLLIVQCNALNSILPGMFQKIEDYTELLLPDNLLREGSVIEQMVTMIPEEDWTDQVQIIGWLYQYYNTEPKDKVFADLKKNIKITKENIPAATQLFTPDWIVHYMVENSLGRLWLEGHPESKSKMLPTAAEQDAFIAGDRNKDDPKWHYYLEEAEQEPEVEAQLAEIRKEYAALKPEEIRVIDPCMGSGHILCVLFDVLVQIYEDYGYTAREAAVKIVENNLWGLDIDDRASQLAYFAVMMKARQYDRRFFTRNIQPHVYSIVESNGISEELIEYFAGEGFEAYFSGQDTPKLFGDIMTIVNDLRDAKEYGSIIKVRPVDFDAIFARFDEIRDEPVPDFHNEQVFVELLPLVHVAETLAKRYHIVVTNPPYAGASGLNDTLTEFLKKNYPNSKSDLFAAFIERCLCLSLDIGFNGMITQQAWMFINSYENLRNSILNKNTIESLIQLGNGAFGFADFGLSSFVIRIMYISDYYGVYTNLTEKNDPDWKENAFLSHNYITKAKSSNYKKIPGRPISYWASKKIYNLFDYAPLVDSVAFKEGITTGDNEKFLRYWTEVDFNNISFNKRETSSCIYWIPCNKGGEYRKWYGNRYFIIDWTNNGEKLRQFKGSSFRNADYQLKEGGTYSNLTSGSFSTRYTEQGFAFESKGTTYFTDDLYSTIGFMNTKIFSYLLKLVCPALDYKFGVIQRLPFLKAGNNAITIVKECISLSQVDWDSFEISWGFRGHPFLLVRAGFINDMKSYHLDLLYEVWKKTAEDRFARLKNNEEELNRIYIDMYELRDELSPEVDDKEITIRRADLKRDVRSFISYAVGCMFGRYSPYVPGLIYAGGLFENVYREDLLVDEHSNSVMLGNGRIALSQNRTYINNNGTWIETQFSPDSDNIIPICDDEYFEDDIVGRFVKFVEVVYGSDALEENLRFIADALGGKGSSREVIRNYFINEFYADHLKVYQKRPIYWLFESGKRNGFKCLIYMHRYQPDTIARIRTDYVHEQQSRYRTVITDLESQMANASTSERVKLTKQLTKIQGQAEELRVYEEKIHHLADQMIRINLDDGVKVNYAKFQDVLAKIK